ncbi:MAG TPA: 3-oxoacyl-ACP reductase [Actinomycetales bacterium]|nr:3-oxoacyl-ACP reductase [Actinomycetales bacterium]
MSDRYTRFTRTPVGRRLAGTLGLPRPVPLRRRSEGGPLLEGDVVVGGTGGTLEEHARAALAGLGVPAVGESEAPAALVLDASGIASPSDLTALHAFFSPRVRGLRTCGRVVVLAHDPSRSQGGAQIAQRALEGFTRSLGKEVGRGSTVNLVHVAPGGEGHLASTLEFLLSGASAYVSGQVLRIGAPVTGEVAVPDPDNVLDGRVAVVTGAARGIGAAIATTLAGRGATVVGLDVPALAGDLATLTRELGGDQLVLDVTAVDAPQRLARHLRERHGGVGVVVHNAGITRDKRLANMKPDVWSRTLDVNLVAPQRITEHLLDEQVIRTNGRVIGVSSIAGIAGNAGQTNYATSKAGVIGLVDALAPRAAEHGVTVNAVAPGFIETQMTARIPLAIREVGRRMNSMNQGGLPVDVAETIAWFAHPGSAGVNGTVVRVCGQSLLGA